GLRDDMRRQRRAADAVLAALHLANSRRRGERGLHRFVEIHGELDLAELALAVLGERRERGEHLARRPAARTDDLPLQLQEPGGDRREAGGESKGAINTPRVGEDERANACGVHVVSLLDVAGEATREVGWGSRARLRARLKSRARLRARLKS